MLLGIFCSYPLNPQNSIELANFLLIKGAYANTMDQHQKTPLTIAKEKGYILFNGSFVKRDAIQKCQNSFF